MSNGNANCPCDAFVFPPARRIDAGLPSLPRQVASFPEWRRSLLHAIATEPTLAHWRARETGDFGLLLLEMGAYVFDVVAFYDQVFAQESYVRTAVQRTDLRHLVAVLGYLPRPAVGALVELALLADGRKSLALPAGVAFRSGAFDGEAAQVFELTEPASVDPLANEWQLLPVRPATIGTGSLSSLLCVPDTVSVRVDDVVIVETPAGLFPRVVTSLTPFTADDGERLTAVAFDAAISINAQTAMADVRLWGGSASGSLWKQTALTGTAAVINGSTIVLDAVNRRVRIGELVMLRKGGDRRAFRVQQTNEVQRKFLSALESTITDPDSKVTKLLSPDITIGTATLTLDRDVNAGAASIWGASDAPLITLYYGFVRAGIPVRPHKTTLAASDPLRVRWPAPCPSVSPGAFLLEDARGDGVRAAGSLSCATHALGVATTTSWPSPLTLPVRAFGNVVSASRGESVHGEVVGVGDARLARQTFTLKKKPLTYLPAGNAGNDQGVATTLVVYVNGVRWTERRSFFDATDQDRVYVVRHDEAGETLVTFGGGARLPTGSVVLADYRHGAGAASPPAGSIVQLAKPVPGLKGVRNPVTAAGGGDAESARDLARLAPRSALLLGRAVSIADFEVATAAMPGVRAVTCEWRWNAQRQRPLVHIDYIGGASLAAVISQKLHTLCDPTVPIAIAQATPVPSRAALEIEIDPTYIASQVLNRVRDRLTAPLEGFLTPEQLGVNRPLFASVLFGVVTTIEGVAGLTGLVWGTGAFPAYGVTAGPGRFFAFASGQVVLNGHGDYV